VREFISLDEVIRATVDPDPRSAAVRRRPGRMATPYRVVTVREEVRF
jgi:hypothetical protein